VKPSRTNAPCPVSGPLLRGSPGATFQCLVRRDEKPRALGTLVVRYITAWPWYLFSQWHDGRLLERRAEIKILPLLLHVSGRPSRYDATFLEKYLAEEASRPAVHIIFLETILVEADFIKTISETVFWQTGCPRWQQELVTQRFREGPIGARSIF
jgi:hypothetical protein